MALTSDRLQAELGEGPCVSVLREHHIFQTGNLPHETRWPNFSQRAHEETGATSILSLRIFMEADTLAALNLYSTQRDAFDDTDVALGTVFAAHAAVAMTSARREEALERKASSRDIIGTAKGILMTREHVTSEEAFQLLVKASQRANVKLVKIAEDVAYIGEIPPSLN
jgi:GAF domain-containing protein